MCAVNIVNLKKIVVNIIILFDFLFFILYIFYAKKKIKKEVCFMCFNFETFCLRKEKSYFYIFSETFGKSNSFSDFQISFHTCEGQEMRIDLIFNFFDITDFVLFDVQLLSDFGIDEELYFSAVVSETDISYLFE